MSEEIQPAETAAELTGTAGDEPPVSFGARLRWERERAGLTVTDVAGRLRLHPNQVRALEEEALARLPEAAYVRGFVRSYARVFAIEPDALLADLATKIAPAGASVVDGMTQARDYSPVRAAAREQTSRRLVVIGAVLLLIVLGVLGWWATHGALPAVTSQTVAPVGSPTLAPPVIASAEPVAASGSVSSAAPLAAAESAAVMEPVPPPPLLKLRFSGPSWAEVKDAEGKPLHSQHNVAGAEFVVEGTPPFYVVIGDVAHVSVEVRGEAYDLAPHTRQNVARFTVN